MRIAATMFAQDRPPMPPLATLLKYPLLGFSFARIRDRCLRSVGNWTRISLLLSLATVSNVQGIKLSTLEL